MRMGMRAVAVLTIVCAVLAHGCGKQTPTAPSTLRPGATGLSDRVTETPVVIRSSGAIEADVAAFRTLLGSPNNLSAPGQQPSGRREVNWDGVPAEFTNNDRFPHDFFNTTVTRGLLYNGGGHDLEVSDRGFTDVNSDYAGVFNTFSPPKLFSPVEKNDVDVRFRVAGTDTKAAVNGIGVVFADVDRLGSTTLELRDEHGDNLGTFTVPVRTDDRGLSFVGVVFSGPRISRVRIVSGNGRLSAESADISNGGRQDLVVMDNFLYGEPTAIDD